MFNDVLFPIVQAPMAGDIVTPELIAEVCNAGMLGSIATGYLSLAACEQLIIKVKALTNKPFVVNIFIEEERHKEITLPKPNIVCQLEQELSVFQTDTFSVPKTINQEQYLELLIKHSVPAVSTTFGIFKTEVMTQLKLHNIKVIANCSSIAEAEYAAINGADVLILQGTDAGGHQASYLSNTVNYLSSMDLLVQVQKLNLKLPLIVAGGINISNVNEYWHQGADMVQLGTLFMLSNLGRLSKGAIEFILSQSSHLGTQITTAITGKCVRGINNDLMHQINSASYPFPIQHYATTFLRAQAKKLNNFSYAGLWLGKHESYQFTSTLLLIKQLKEKYLEFCNEKSAKNDH